MVAVAGAVFEDRCRCQAPLPCPTLMVKACFTSLPQAPALLPHTPLPHPFADRWTVWA